MIVGRPLLSDIAHRFRCRFTKSNPNAHMRSTPANTDLKSTMQFPAKIQQDSRLLSLIFQHASRWRNTPTTFRSLPMTKLKQHRLVLY